MAAPCDLLTTVARLRSLSQNPEPGKLVGKAQMELFAPPSEASLEEASRLLDGWQAGGMRCLDMRDAGYPENLRQAATPPLLIFVRGQALPQDRRSVAVVGTRSCSEAGRRRALRLGRSLADAGLTVVSGLALGVDTAAHQGALASREGRTVAVVGTGLLTIYPPSNRSLHDRIAATGAVLSQFWPDFKGHQGGANFLARNQTMAELTLGTVVIEAGQHSGARSQAVYAHKRGKPVFLLRSLVQSEDWAREMAKKPLCFVVDGVKDVLENLLEMV